MIFIENIANSFESIFANKLRTFLSILWIIIWVSSVIILWAIWEGSKQSVVENIQALWTNMLTISPWWQRSTDVYSKQTSQNLFTLETVASIKTKVDWLKWVLPLSSGKGQLIYGANNMSVTINWISTDYLDVTNTKVVMWQNITNSDIDSLKKVVVIWNTIYTDIFNSENPIGKSVKIWNALFFVIWVIEEKWWNSQTDSSVFIPISTAQIRVLWSKYLNQIQISVEDSLKVDEKETEISALLSQLLKVTDTNTLPFSIRNQADLLSRVSTITWTLTLLLSWIAAISLIVGWIWVMNIMLVSVTERTKEIWIRKAIWAKKLDILTQFLMESLILSILGWVIWILFSYFVIYILTTYLSIAWVIVYNSIVMSFSFALAIWVIFWLLPAYKASKLRPIDALRYE